MKNSALSASKPASEKALIPKAICEHLCNFRSEGTIPDDSGSTTGYVIRKSGE
jgi:hypothetical protein